MNGKYDFLHENRFHLQWTVSHEEVEARFVVSPSPLLALYNQIDARARALYRTVTGDALAEERTLFAEAMHFCTMMPFHLTGDGREAKSIAIYLTGAMLFNEVFERFGIAPDTKTAPLTNEYWGQQEWRNVG
ncbi:hypothetical protein AJ88_43185 [Mesorhizobium amorphae CCBAU 01583]|nr:hypothetical protein AJ88_43185 [Mesorhizobium amorphae CCBAU 01583]